MLPFKPDDKVLEIGGNIGRNSLIIASILKHDTNFVTLECDKNIATQLKENRDLNHFKFHIENSALSKRNLIQKGFLPNSFKIPVLIIIHDKNLQWELHEKHSIKRQELYNKTKIKTKTKSVGNKRVKR